MRGKKKLKLFDESLREAVKFAQGKKTKVKVETITLTERDWNRLEGHMKNPPKPNRKLKAAARRHSRKNENKSILDRGKLLGKSKNWKIYAPGPKLNKELDEARKKVKSGKVKYRKLEN